MSKRDKRRRLRAQFGMAVTWKGSTPILKLTANAVDTFRFVYDGKQWKESTSEAEQ